MSGTIDYDAYAAALVPLAARLIGAVRYEGHAGSRAVFEQLRRIPPPPGVHPAEALAVILAAMVDEDRTPNELLAWVDATQLTDHTIGEMTAREALAARRRCNAHGTLLPPAVRDIVNAARRRSTVDRAVDNADQPVDGTANSCGNTAKTGVAHLVYDQSSAPTPTPTRPYGASPSTLHTDEPAQPHAAATTEEVA
jgi:hypothetical protein